MAGVDTAIKLAVQYAPQAISTAKNLAQKFAPEMLTAAESALPEGTSALFNDNGYSRFTYLAKQIISTDNSFVQNLFSLSDHLSESHPQLSSRVNDCAKKLLAKTGLSDSDISFLHENLTNISSTENTTQVNSPGSKAGPTHEDVYDVIHLIAKGNLSEQKESELINFLNNQQAVPIKEVKERLQSEVERLHPQEPVEAQTEVSHSETEANSNVSIIDGSLTGAQQKTVLEAAARIPLKVGTDKNTELSLLEIVKQNISNEGTQSSLSIIGNNNPGFFEALNLIGTEKSIGLPAFKTAVTGLLTAFNINIPGNMDLTLNALHNIVNPTKPQVASPEDSPKPQAKQTSTQTPNQPLDFLVSNIRDVLVREVKGSSTLFGMAQRAVGAAKTLGIPLPETLSKVEDLGKVLDSLVLTDDFKSSLEKSIKGESVDFQGQNELQTRAFQIINWGVWSINKLPKVAIEYFPLAVNALKWAMPVARFIPVFGGVLCTTYPILDEVAKVIDKFQVEAENIRTACTAIKGQTTSTTNAASNEKPTETTTAKKDEELVAATSNK